VCSKMFSLAVRWRMRDSNPVRGVERNHETRRRRYLTGDELPRLVEALAAYPDPQAANIIRLLLMTGARSGEVFGMRWADIDTEQGVWTKLASSTKQKQDHTVPLSAPARMLLTEIAATQQAKGKTLGSWVFPSTKNPSGHVAGMERSWASILKQAGITGLRVHDLRHSFASELVSSGASLPLIGALLGHSNPNTTARYAHLFDDPMRKAVDRVGATIEAAGNGGAGAKVAPFPKAGRRRR
jgi:integrase